MNNYVHACGTPACVLGYFASRVDLQRKFVLAKNAQGYMTCQLRVQDHDYPVDYEDTQVLGYFGINREQAEYLFGGGYPNDGKTPAQMRRKIRKFIDKNGRCDLERSGWLRDGKTPEPTARDTNTRADCRLRIARCSAAR